MDTMHLFAGIGGGLLCDLILGHKPIIAVEWDKYACRILRERAADGWFPDLSVWEGDVRMFDPSEYAGRVDCIHAGFPCVDISVAGKQAGVGEETRSGLYREILRIADVVRPEYLFLENVSAILANGLSIVLGDLSARGYSARWICIRASDVGANHGRDRWWLLARRTGMADADMQHGIRRGESRIANGTRGEAWTEPFGGGAEMGNTMRLRHQRQWEYINPGNQAQNREGQAGDALDERIESEWAAQPCLGSVANEFPDFLVPGWWEVEPNVGRVTDESKDRTAQLKGLGNAQVPLQAAVAFSMLHEGSTLKM